MDSLVAFTIGAVLIVTPILMVWAAVRRSDPTRKPTVAERLDRMEARITALERHSGGAHTERQERDEAGGVGFEPTRPRGA